MRTDDAAHLLDQADRFRRLAPKLYDGNARVTILRLAEECELRAERAVRQSVASTTLAPRIKLPTGRW
jgi:hypothetical protein